MKQIMSVFMLLTIGCAAPDSPLKRIKLVKKLNVINRDVSSVIDNVVLDMNNRANEEIIGDDDKYPIVTVAYGEINISTVAGQATCYRPSNNCDIVINSNLRINNPEPLVGYAKEYSYYFLETLIRHEIGHTFGMRHTHPETPHIMNPEISTGNIPESYPYDSNYINLLNIFASDLNNQRRLF
jgi:hypothetical protein